MRLNYWDYMGPGHIGVLKCVQSFERTMSIIHCPLGDDYFNVMSTMLTRDPSFTPVCSSIVDRHVLAAGSRSKVVSTIVRKGREDTPELIVVTPTCTSSILQEDIHNYVQRAQAQTDAEVIYAEVSHYRHSEAQAQDMMLHQVTRRSLERAGGAAAVRPTRRPSVNLIGVVDLGFHNRDDAREFRRLLAGLGIEVNQVYPRSSRPDAAPLLDAWVNVAPYRELGFLTVEYLRSAWGMPYVDVAPIGLGGIREFVLRLREALNGHVQAALGPARTAVRRGLEGDHFDALLGGQWKDYLSYGAHTLSQAGWFARSIDCQNLLGKRAVVFADATHAACMTRVLAGELGIKVVCAGTYSKHDAAWFRERVGGYAAEVLVTHDHTEVGQAISRLKPDAIFGSQMERHIGKRLAIPCGVISAPCHIQDHPLGFRPFVGYEGANQVLDLVYNTFRLGMEDHMLELFGGHDTEDAARPEAGAPSDGPRWSPEAEEELRRAVPGFVRGRARAFTDAYALGRGQGVVTVDVLYDAMEEHGRGR